jgi:carboxymethylenebutenolidase
MAASCQWVDVADGLKGYYGQPEGDGPFPGVVIYIEAFGVNDHFKRLTARFAEAGYAALTPDIFDGAIYSYDDLDNAIGHLSRMDDDKVMAQTGQCLDFLAARPEVDGDRVGVTGFCMGGRFAFLANAALGGRFKAAVAFYGGGIGPVEDFAGRKTLLDRAPEMAAPITLFYGAEDQSILPDELGRIAEALAKANKRFTMTVFPGVGHGFFCEERASYDEEAADVAWRGTLHFFGAHLGH